jgi:hypothetical protein
MNDPDDYYRTLAEDRQNRWRPPTTGDAVDRAAAAIGEPLSPPDVDHV